MNAREHLPQELIDRVLAHLPPDRRERVLLYLHTDYYAARDAEVVAAFEGAVQAEAYGTLTEVYEALGRRYCLSPRRIWSIVRAGRDEPPVTAWRRRRQEGRRPRRIRRSPTVGRPRGLPAARPAVQPGDDGEAQGPVLP